MSDEYCETNSIALLMIQQIHWGEIRQECPSAPHPFVYDLAHVVMCDFVWVGLGGSYPRM